MNFVKFQELLDTAKFYLLTWMFMFHLLPET